MGLGIYRLFKNSVIWYRQDSAALFIAEIWLDEIRLSEILNQKDFGQFHIVSKVALGVGLALIWKHDFDLTVDTSSLNHIDAIINKGKEEEWRFTSFYGASKTHKHHESWNIQKNLNQKFSLPWLCGGDFNEILKSHEKYGRRPRPINQMQ